MSDVEFPLHTFGHFFIYLMIKLIMLTSNHMLISE
jgi:hypothetical protein